MTVIRDPISNSELETKKNTDDQLDKKTIVIFNQTLQNYLKVSVGSDIYSLTNYHKIQLLDATIKKLLIVAVLVSIVGIEM